MLTVTSVAEITGDKNGKEMHLLLPPTFYKIKNISSETILLYTPRLNEKRNSSEMFIHGERLIT